MKRTSKCFDLANLEECYKKSKLNQVSENQVEPVQFDLKKPKPLGISKNKNDDHKELLLCSDFCSLSLDLNSLENFHKSLNNHYSSENENLSCVSTAFTI